jgi:hypothetical protein
MGVTHAGNVAITAWNRPVNEEFWAAGKQGVLGENFARGRSLADV